MIIYIYVYIRRYRALFVHDDFFASFLFIYHDFFLALFSSSHKCRLSFFSFFPFSVYVHRADASRSDGGDSRCGGGRCIGYCCERRLLHLRGQVFLSRVCVC